MTTPCIERAGTMSGQVTRRVMLAGLGSTAAAAGGVSNGTALAQSVDPGKPTPRFGYDDVVRRAKDIASVPFDAAPAQLPQPIANLDFDAWREIGRAHV